MNKVNVAYFLATGLLTAMMFVSVGMYLFNHAAIQMAFTILGYPTYIIYPLAVAKLLGLLAIWTGIFPRLAHMAYAGFFFNFLLAIAAHVAVGDTEFPGAVMALLLLGSSYWAWGKRQTNSAADLKTAA